MTGKYKKTVFLFALLMIFSLVNCRPDRVPTDNEIIDIVQSYKPELQEYVQLLTTQKKWARISTSNIGGKEFVYSNLEDVEMPEESNIVEDFSKKLKIDLALIQSFRDVNESSPNEIAFYSYREGYAKGISHIVDHDELILVDDLSRYGTKDDPRILNGVKGKVYRKIEGNWFVFAQ